MTKTHGEVIFTDSSSELDTVLSAVSRENLSLQADNDQFRQLFNDALAEKLALAERLAEADVEKKRLGAQLKINEIQLSKRNARRRVTGKTDDVLRSELLMAWHVMSELVTELEGFAFAVTGARDKEQLLATPFGERLAIAYAALDTLASEVSQEHELSLMVV